MNSLRAQLDMLLDYALGMWRFRWQALGVIWAICMLGWLFVMAQPDTFRAAAQVQVDRESMLRPLLRGLAVDTNVMDRFDMITQVLLSRPNLEAVAREADLDLGARTPQEMERLLAELRSAVDIDGGRDDIYSISYFHPDREVALTVVNTLLDQLVEGVLSAGRSDTSSAQKFLSQQLTESESRLKQAEDKLAAFKRENLGRMPADRRGGYYEELQSQVGELNRIDAQLLVAMNRRNELLRQLEGEEPVFGFSPQTSMMAEPTPVDGQIGELEARLSELSLRFTEKHPEIIRIREILAGLYAERDATRAARPSGGVMNPLDMNPVYQSMKVALSQVELEIADLRTQRGQKQREVSELRSLVDTLPTIEAELSRLDRNYEMARTQYETLLSRFETAKFSEEVEENAEDIQVRIIEPPSASFNAVGPPRALYQSMVLVVALAAGIGLALLMQILDPAVSTRGMLERIAGHPVIGQVPRQISDDERRAFRRERLYLTGAVAGLAALMASMLIWTAPLSGLAQKLAGSLPL